MQSKEMKNMSEEEKYQELLKKVEKAIKEKKIDLSSDQDLSIGIMNLISIEEHLFFTAQKTKKDEYYKLLKEVRDMRKVLLKKLIKEYEGEVWCISKHLLASSMRLMEVGTKFLNESKIEQAKELFNMSYRLYSIFWEINLKKNADFQLQSNNKEDNSSQEQKKDEKDLVKKLKFKLEELVNCCIE